MCYPIWLWKILIVLIFAGTAMTLVDELKLCRAVRFCFCVLDCFFRMQLMPCNGCYGAVIGITIFLVIPFIDKFELVENWNWTEHTMTRIVYRIDDALLKTAFLWFNDCNTKTTGKQCKHNQTNGVPGKQASIFFLINALDGVHCINDASEKYFDIIIQYYSFKILKHMYLFNSWLYQWISWICT